MSLDISKQIKKRQKLFIKYTKLTLKDMNKKNIHDMRVSFRRLESSIETFNYIYKYHDKDLKVKKIKKLFKALGQIRDIQIQQSLIKDLKLTDDYSTYLDYLNKELNQIRQNFKTLIKEISVEDIEKSMKKTLKQITLISKEKPKALKKKNLRKIYDESKGQILDLFKELDFGDMEDIHQTRIRLKKYRYRLEIISSEIKISKYELIILARTQDLMGEIQDIENLILNLKDFYGEDFPNIDILLNIQREKVELLKKEHIPEIK